MKRYDSRSGSSCAACKLLKRKCTPNCIFAPYFPPDKLQSFAKIHKVFGASNASKILSEVRQDQRAEAVNSLVFEAEARVNDPVYGCIGAMNLLQTKMVQLQHDLAITKAHLACYTNDNFQDLQHSPDPVENYAGAIPLDDYDGIGNEITSDVPKSSELQQLDDERLDYPYGPFGQH
ncbi:Lob domain-containing protein [Thalictrum thalictroides]|uniref:Lob domain-containing protein n=1 Tax=Thalictrum thalictroides TaxID=46969 RepID=A0A7J6WWG9_THATH|nr:Lob domain-containing protein [Thalictrum thalictroides]